MYKDIISYELADNTSRERLLEIAGQVVRDWMKLQSGFVRWEIHTNRDGSYTDIVYWASEADAKKAEQEMANIPNAGAWYGCYKEGTITSKNLVQVAQF